MSFIGINMTPLGGNSRAGEDPNLNAPMGWAYSSQTDDSNDLLSTGYFDTFNKQLVGGQFIYASLTDGKFIFTVSAVDRDLQQVDIDAEVFSPNNFKTIPLTRTIPSTVDDAIDLGSFAFTQGASALIITITVNTSSFSVSKEYLLPVQFDQTAGVFETVLPISSTGPFTSDDFDLDINVDDAVTSLRIRKSAGTLTGSASILIKQEGINSDPFTPSSATNSVTAPTAFFSSTPLTQVNGNVGIGKGLPEVKLDVEGSIKIRDALLFSDDSTQAQAALPDDSHGNLSTAKFKDKISISTNSPIPSGMFVTNDEKKLFVTSVDIPASIDEYDLTTKGDITSRVFVQSQDISAQTTTPNNLVLIDDGLDLYLLGSGSVFQYKLGTKNSLSVFNFFGSFPIATPLPTGIAIKPDRRSLFISDIVDTSVEEYNFGTINDVTTLQLIDSNEIDGNELRDISFRADGTKMYTIDSVDDLLRQYDLPDRWTILSNVLEGVFDVSNEDQDPSSITINPEGTKIFILGSSLSNAIQYDLGIDVEGNSIFDSVTTDTLILNDSIKFHDDSTQKQAALSASLNSTITTTSFEKSKDITPTSTLPFGIAFDPTGLIMLIIDSSSRLILEFALSKAHDIDTAVPTGNSFSTAGIVGFASGLTFGKKGFKLYTTDNTGNKIVQIDLSVAHDITSAAFNGKKSPTLPTGAPVGIVLHPEGNKVFVVDRNTTETVYALDLSIDWEIDTAVFNSESFDITSETVDPIAFDMRSDGKKIWILSNVIGDNLIEYDIPNPWIISNLEFNDEKVDVSAQAGTGASGLFVREDIKKLYITGSTAPATIFQYELGLTSKGVEVSRVGETVNEIFKPSDMGTGAGTGVILVKNNGRLGFNLKNAMTFEDRLDLSLLTTRFNMFTDDRTNTKITVNATGKFFTNVNLTDTFSLFGMDYNFTDDNCEFGDITAAQIFVRGVAVSFDSFSPGVRKIGTFISTVTQLFNETSWQGMTDGATISASNLRILQSLFVTNPVVGGTETLFDVTALTGSGSFSFLGLVLLQSGQSVFGLADTISVPIVINDCPLSGPSTNYYESGAFLDQTSPNMVVRDSDGSPDSNIAGGFHANGVATQTVLNAVTYTDLIWPATRTAFSYNERISYAGAVNGELEFTGGNSDSIIVPFEASLTPSVAADRSILLKLVIDKGAGYVDLPDLVETEIFFKGSAIKANTSRRIDVDPADKVKWQAIQVTTLNVTLESGDIMV